MPVRKQGGKLVHVLRMSIADRRIICLSVIREQDRGNVSRAERGGCGLYGSLGQLSFGLTDRVHIPQHFFLNRNAVASNHVAFGNL